MKEVLVKFKEGNRLALSRLISIVENRSEEVPEIMTEIHGQVSGKPVLGITGPPGAGKSTLVNQVIAHIRKMGKTVGVIAIDPSSPFTGGAVLGDRIRMQEHIADEGVFIRSLGSRGAHGGLSRATRDVVQLFDAFGTDWILVETVGVGQTELDIMEIASTTLVVLTPESGDTIQTMKAGLLEVADVFAINKSDREGADRIKLEIMSMIEMSGRADWQVPVIKTIAQKAEGIPELFAEIEKHEDYIRKSGRLEAMKAKVRADELLEILVEGLQKRWKDKLSHDAQYLKLVQSVQEGKKSPYQAASEVLKKI